MFGREKGVGVGRRSRRKVAIYSAVGLTLAVALLAGLATVAVGASSGRPSGSTAQVPMMTPQEMMKQRVTPQKRDAAAKRLAAQRRLGLDSPSLSFSSLGSIPTTFDPQGTPDYLGGVVPNYANSQLPTLDANGRAVPGTGIRKFVDSLPGLGYANRNNLGQYMPVAVPDQTTYPGCDYYEIALVQYTEKLGSDLPPTTLRGYVQTNVSDPRVSKPSYLGPAIIAQADRPVRVKFTNKLPTGSGGDLFLPTDTTAMGAGTGPNGTDRYTQNRATLHLHGGATPWISDGTPNQWVTPAGENTPYPKGVSVSYVPDMWFDANGTPVATGTPGASNDPGAGSETFYYTNQQSARLMFYHDHSYGITRLNVYAGEAAPYLIQDKAEKALVSGGTVASTTVKPGTLPADQIPLVIQDKTFVPSDSQLLAEDPTWDKAKWGGAGNLWFPHVYMPNQNPEDVSGANPMGRWDYGPWFWPPLTTAAGLVHGPVGGNPGTPNPSLTPESFMDTPLVNGTAYPYVKVARKVYRLRILNACNDRSLNLSLFYAASNKPDSTDANGNPTFQGQSGEVPMVPAVARTAAVPLSPIYALYNLKTHAHYYTRSRAQARRLLAKRPRLYTDLGVAMRYAAKSPLNNAPLYQIYNKKKGSWYYTTSWSEVKKFKKSPKTYRYDGIVWHVSKVNVAGSQPVYGFVDSTTGDWLLTTDRDLKANLRAKVNLSRMKFKGVRFYAAQTGGPTAPTGWPDTWPTDGRAGGVPAPEAAGPAMVQIGTEGGFLPKPVVIKPQPVGYNYNRRDIVVLNVADKSLLLGPAERADVLVDFTGVPDGSKLILYNDSPAPMPAFDPRYDYYTGDPDQTDTGGAPSTLPGYGPNTRTIMQFQVGGAVGTPLDMNALNAGISAAFKATQPAPIVPEKAYGDPTDNYVRIQDNQMVYTPNGASGPVTMPLQPKAIQELFELQYGRMNATLGVEQPLTNFNTQTTIPLGYLDPATEDMVDSASALSSPTADGTQIWKITHNGVDTHAIHFHLFNVQVINRVGWDGAIRPPDDNELGWKETVRMNPLEDCIVAMRPAAPTLPFKIPDSIRPMDPTMAIGATMTVTDPASGNAVVTHNMMMNFGWEYVWHCHLLGHEENDMMRPIIFHVSPAEPSGLAVSASPTAGVDVAWTDNATKPPATNFLVERADDAGFTVNVVDTSIPEPITSWNDASAVGGHTYYYRVRAENNISYSVWTGAKTITLP